MLKLVHGPGTAGVSLGRKNRLLKVMQSGPESALKCQRTMNHGRGKLRDVCHGDEP